MNRSSHNSIKSLMKMRRILVTGSSGQIGSELVPALRGEYGDDNVISSDIRPPQNKNSKESGPFVVLDVLDKDSVSKVFVEHEIDTVFHLAAILSAKGESMPQIAWEVNIHGLFNMLEFGRKHDIERIIWPSSIAAFGPTSPRENTPNDTILQPNTIYGITKVTGELLVEYFYKKYGLDARSMRLPGIISTEALPGGGTTDYAVEIFYEAIKNKFYTCFLKEDTVLPMMYMPDCIKCMIDLLEADSLKLKRHVYNVTAMSFSPSELAAEIKKNISDFKIEYKPDFRQEIADSWPKTIDDSLARKEWGWNPSYDLEDLVNDMINKLGKRLLK